MRMIEVEADAQFRAQVRDWLHDNVPRAAPPTDRRERREYDLAWQLAQYEGGYAGVSWPAEYGGCGLGLSQQLIWFEEYVRANAPDIGCGFVGINHAGPTLIAQASDEQKAFRSGVRASPSRVPAAISLRFAPRGSSTATTSS
jgi:alkylation response protein AidB-like acyl-CoA dehydrogenase